MSRYIWNPDDQHLDGGSDFDDMSEADTSCGHSSLSNMVDEEVNTYNLLCHIISLFSLYSLLCVVFLLDSRARDTVTWPTLVVHILMSIILSVTSHIRSVSSHIPNSKFILTIIHICNFFFYQNLSQLASINYDLLIKSAQDSIQDSKPDTP